MCIKLEFKIILKLATNGQNDKAFLLTSKVCPQGVVCPCPGTIYVYKINKNVYKIRFLFSNLQRMGKVITNGQSDKGFLLTSKVCPQGVVCSCAEAIYMYKIIKNVYKSVFKEIILKLVTYGQREKAFLLSSKFCPQYVVCPCPRLFACGKTWKNMFKIRLQRDCFKTCNKWAKW